MSNNQYQELQQAPPPYSPQNAEYGLSPYLTYHGAPGSNGSYASNGSHGSQGSQYPMVYEDVSLNVYPSNDQLVNSAPPPSYNESTDLHRSCREKEAELGEEIKKFKTKYNCQFFGGTVFGVVAAGTGYLLWLMVTT